VFFDKNSDANIREILHLQRHTSQLSGSDNAAGGYIGLYVTDDNNGGEMARISWRGDNNPDLEGNGRLGFWTADSTGSHAENMDIYERMTITKDGYVGIGTTSPSQLLEVNGNVKANTIQLQTTTASASYSGSNVTIDANGASYATFDLGITASASNEVVTTYTLNNTVDNGQYVLLIRVSASGNYSVTIGAPGGGVTTQFWGYSASNYDALNGERILMTFYVFNGNTYISLAPFS